MGTANNRLPIRKLSLAGVIEQVRDGEPLIYPRWGDAEWHAVLGEYGRTNQNGCLIGAGVGVALREVLRRQSPYPHGILRIARRTHGRRLIEYLAQREIRIDWVGGDLLLDATLRGRLWPLIQVLREKRILYVNAGYLRQLEDEWFPLAGFVEIPPQNAIRARKVIVRSVLELAAEREADLIGWSAGMHAKAFIDDVYQQNPEIHQLDFGSMWDGFFGVKSRSYIRRGRQDFAYLRRVNLGLEERDPARILH